MDRSSSKQQRPELGDLIPWTSDGPKLKEGHIGDLSELECREWLSRLISEREAIKVAIEEHERRCRINQALVDIHWRAKCWAISRQCNELITLINVRLSILNAERRKQFKELFVQAAYEILSVDHLEEILNRVAEMSADQPRRPGPVKRERE